MSYPLRLNDSPPWNALPVEFLQKGSHATWQRKRLNPSLHPDFLGPTWPPLVCFPTLCKEELLLLPWRPIRQQHDFGDSSSGYAAQPDQVCAVSHRALPDQTLKMGDNHSADGVISAAG